MHKLLILLPRVTDDFVVYFPFLIHAYRLFEEPEINLLISSDENRKYDFSLLPFKVATYQVDESSLSLTRSGQLAYQLQDVFNITYFFNLRDEARYAYLGRAFRAKFRVGYAGGVKKIAYTHPVERVPTHKKDESYTFLLEQVAGSSLETVSLKDDEEIAGSEAIIIYLCASNEEQRKHILALLEETFDELVDYPMIWLGDRDETVESLPFTQLTYQVDQDVDALRQLFATSKGLITNVLWAARLACLYEMNHVLITDDERKIQSFSTIKSPLSLIRMKDEKALYYMGPEEEESLSEEGQVTDLVLRLFKV